MSASGPSRVAVLPPTLFVTGTDTGVGKTVVTAALAAALSAGGRSVAVYKPTQAGLEDGAGDIDRVRALGGIDDVHEGIRLRHPMAPVAAAEREGVTLPTAAAHVSTIQRLASEHDHTLVEGAGGVLVQLDSAGRTLADIAVLAHGATAAIVVCSAALGTLNHTELTIEALARRGVPLAGLIIGSWPREPTEINVTNRRYLRRHSVPLLGAVPEQAGKLPPAEFQSAAPAWFVALAA
ncbi:MAG TPA: dethiobiotin synthase [Solirubrobacteraceae bacterium]|nr:dethiobiotin synthase [Solirubrobacteraceae bacterium]